MKVTDAISGAGRVYEIHQSDIAEYQLCPERARAKWFGEVEDGPTDATAAGTAAHAGIETLILGGDWSDALGALHGAWALEANHPRFRYTKVKTAKTAIAHATTALENWATFIEPHLDAPAWVEYHFDEHLMWIGDTTEVRLAGIVDFADQQIWDWKTAGNLKKYEGWPGDGWKLKRWDIQPTVYCWAAARLGVLDDPWTFTWAALAKTERRAVMLTAERGPWVDAWLRRLAANIVMMYESGLPEWPINDQHALCSPEYCPAWDQCKGKAMREATDVTFDGTMVAPT